jgi:hypothetical protein|tara:strand:+ start:1828 stop:2196 length:369 start_codon:yes stop_codon:yes gene_type:complete
MFIKGNQYGSKSKRGKNKIDLELKNKLKELAEGIIEKIDIEELSKTQHIQLLKSVLPYLMPKEYINDTYIQEDLPLFVDDKPVVIAFSDSKQREEYNNADEGRKAEMEKELRVDMWGNNASA